MGCINLETKVRLELSYLTLPIKQSFEPVSAVLFCILERCPVSRTRRHEPKIIWAWPRWEKPVQMRISYNPDPSTSTMCLHCWSLTQVPCLFLDNFDIRKLKNRMFERSPLGLHFGYDTHCSDHHTSELPCCPKPAIICTYKYLLI